MHVAYTGCIEIGLFDTAPNIQKFTADFTARYSVLANHIGIAKFDNE